MQWLTMALVWTINDISCFKRVQIHQHNIHITYKDLIYKMFEKLQFNFFLQFKYFKSNLDFNCWHGLYFAIGAPPNKA